MTLRKLALGLAAAVAITVPALAQSPRSPDGSPQTQSEFVAARIYRALLGRDADPPVLAEVAADVEQGRIRQRVNAIVISQEFRSHIYGWPPDRILAQIYQGLLEHDPDEAAASWQHMISMAKYADVIAGILETPEFKAKLAPFGAVTITDPAAPAGATELPPSITCQESVVEAIRKDLGGVVFIQFDAAAIDGATISGAATDVNGGGRRLTYRCDPTAAYRYDDGRRERQAAVAAFASDAVRACQTDVALKAQHELGAAQLVFQSAGLMIGGKSSHLVRGVATERMPSGAAGPIFSYSCDMDGTQVTASSIRSR